jgi:leader peptidase (prepilin peptidase) / N-methyltransferase
MIGERQAVRSEHDLRPNAAIVVAGAGAIALVSALALPWPFAIASIVLGVLMLAGADVDARTYLLPDAVTWGALACGVLAAPALDPSNAWHAAAAAIARAATAAATLALVRWCYARLRGREGLGFGDVKLAAAVGAWLPLESIPLCFGLATGAALVSIMSSRLRGERFEATTKIPFGAFLCPALWLIFYAGALWS